MSVRRRLLDAAGRLAAAAVETLGPPRISTLIFHRVLPSPDPLLPGEIDAARFERLMAIVACSFRVLPLAEAAARLKDGVLPARAVCITFDDGYADNHDVALPILQRLGLPASFFVATGFLNGGRMFNDTVIEAVRRSPNDQVDLSALGLGPLPLRSAVERVDAIRRILPVVKYMSPDARGTALQHLCDVLRPGRLPDHLMMTSAQVRAMHAAGMTIGAHTVRHPILATLDDAAAAREIAEGREELQALIDAPVDLLAYPNGRPDRDYDRRHVAMARRQGFSAAVSTAPGCAGAQADPFQLPRFTPWDDGDGAWLARLVASRRPRDFAVASRLAPAAT